MSSSKAALLLVAIIAYFLVVEIPVLLSAQTSGSSRPIVVTTTTVLGSIVGDLAGDLVDVEVVASPAVCPAHYDVKPSDIEKIRMAGLVLAHGMEPWVDSLVAAAGGAVPVAKVGGGWGTPQQLKRLYSSVAQALEEYLGLDLGDRLSKCLSAIDSVESTLKNMARDYGFEGVPVVSMAWQKPFVEFLGFKVVASYGPPETVTQKLYIDVIANATLYGAVLVIDNLQSGTDLGESIAKEIGAVHVALSNFPGVSPETSNMTGLMLYNAKILARALGEAQARSELSKAMKEVEFWRALSVALGGLSTSLAIGVAILALRSRR